MRRLSSRDKTSLYTPLSLLSLRSIRQTPPLIGGLRRIRIFILDYPIRHCSRGFCQFSAAQRCERDLTNTSPP